MFVHQWSLSSSDIFSTPLPSSLGYLESRTTDNASEPENCVFNEGFKYVLLPVTYSIVFVVGLILNTISLWMFTCQMRPWNPSTIYMFNLTVSDTLYLFSLPLLAYYYSKENYWPFGVGLCKIVRFLFYTNLYGSILFLTCISMHRYVGICHPIWALKWVNVKYASIICACVWVVVIICIIPNLFFVTVRESGNTTLCYDTTTPDKFEQYVYYSSVIMILLFAIPIVVIIVCYCLMAKELSKPFASSSISNESISMVKKKSLKMVIIVLVVIIICFVPFHITRTLYYTFRLYNYNCHKLNTVNLAYKLTRPLASSNSCLDPILYFFAGDNYRNKLLQALAKVCPSERLPLIWWINRSEERK
ncbi:P2Y purinoceptor 4-like isoform X2 [Protopterus annectens]|nr:P2Y purinoceptor 4-like isoform X2 [Protopterus annectens]